jgi:hypothetical protein
MSDAPNQAVITPIHPDDPALCVRLEAKAPVIGHLHSGTPRHGDWTLDLVERTCFEFRSAGAWDEARVEFGGYPASMTCEVLAQRGADAMPWGWRPSQGTPPRPEPAPDPVVPGTAPPKLWLLHLAGDILGNRVLHGVLLLAIWWTMCLR